MYNFLKTPNKVKAIRNYLAEGGEARVSQYADFYFHACEIIENEKNITRARGKLYNSRLIASEQDFMPKFQIGSIAAINKLQTPNEYLKESHLTRIRHTVK